MHIFEHKLSIKEENTCVHAAEMLVIKAKVVVLSPAETIEAAAILQGDGQLASSTRDHVRDL